MISAAMSFLYVRMRGCTLEQTSLRFGVGRASLSRWLKRLEPDQSKPHKRKIDMIALAEDVRKYPDAYQYERVIPPKNHWVYL